MSAIVRNKNPTTQTDVAALLGRIGESISGHSRSGLPSRRTAS